MATISKYQIASGATLYRVRYRTPDNRSRQKRGFRTSGTRSSVTAHDLRHTAASLAISAGAIRR